MIQWGTSVDQYDMIFSFYIVLPCFAGLVDDWRGCHLSIQFYSDTIHNESNWIQPFSDYKLQNQAVSAIARVVRCH